MIDEAGCPLFQGEFLQRMTKLKTCFDRILAPVVHQYGLTSLSVFILFFVSTQKGLTVGDVNKMLDLNQGNLSMTLKKLESHGYIHRSRGVEDERKVFIDSTEKGERVLSDIRSELKRYESIVEKIPRSDLDTAYLGFLKFCGIIEYIQSEIISAEAGGKRQV